MKQLLMFGASWPVMRFSSHFGLYCLSLNHHFPKMADDLKPKFQFQV